MCCLIEFMYISYLSPQRYLYYHNLDCLTENVILHMGHACLHMCHL